MKFLYPTCIYHPHRGWPHRNFVKVFDADRTTMIGQKVTENGTIWISLGMVSYLPSIVKQELISRLDSWTLPLEPRHRCTRSELNTCLRNDVLASCLLTKTHPRWRDSYTRHIDRPHLQWSRTIRFQGGNASTLNIVIFINHTLRQTDNANIRKILHNKSKKEIYVINGTPST